MKELLQEVGVDKLREDAVREARSQALSEVVSLQEQVTELRAEVEMLRSSSAKCSELVDKKQVIIDGLRAEVRGLRAKIRSTYDVEAIEEIGLAG